MRDKTNTPDQITADKATEALVTNAEKTEAGRDFLASLTPAERKRAGAAVTRNYRNGR